MTPVTVITVVTTTITTAVTAKVASAGAIAIFAWLGFIYFQSAAAEFFTIELFNSCRSFCV